MFNLKNKHYKTVKIYLLWSINARYKNKLVLKWINKNDTGKSSNEFTHTHATNFSIIAHWLKSRSYLLSKLSKD